MGKYKEKLLKEQDNLMEYYFSFYDWLERYRPNELNESDIDILEEEHNQKLILSNINEVNNSSYKLATKEEM